MGWFKKLITRWHKAQINHIKKKIEICDNKYMIYDIYTRLKPKYRVERILITAIKKLSEDLVECLSESEYTYRDRSWHMHLALKHLFTAAALYCMTPIEHCNEKSTKLIIKLFQGSLKIYPNLHLTRSQVDEVVQMSTKSIASLCSHIPMSFHGHTDINNRISFLKTIKFESQITDGEITIIDSPAVINRWISRGDYGGEAGTVHEEEIEPAVSHREDAYRVVISNNLDTN